MTELRLREVRQPVEVTQQEGLLFWDGVYLEEGVQVGQRGPDLSGLAGKGAVGIVLVGGHHINSVVAKGAIVEGVAVRQVAGVAAVRGGRWGGFFAPQQRADGEAPTAQSRVPGRLRRWQLCHRGLWVSGEGARIGGDMQGGFIGWAHSREETGGWPKPPTAGQQGPWTGWEEEHVPIADLPTI